MLSLFGDKLHLFTEILSVLLALTYQDFSVIDSENPFIVNFRSLSIFISLRVSVVVEIRKKEEEMNELMSELLSSIDLIKFVLSRKSLF